MLNWIRSSFKRQTTLTLLVFGIMLITAILAVDYPRKIQQVHDILQHQLTEFAANLSILISDDVRYNKYFILSDRLEKIHNHNIAHGNEGLLFKIKQIAVLDSAGMILGHTQPAEYPLQTKYSHPDFSDAIPIDTEHTSAIAFKWIEGENKLWVRSQVWQGMDNIGSVIIEADTSAIRKIRDELIQDFVVTFTVMLGLAFLLSGFYARQIEKPLQTIIRHIDTIGEGELVLPEIERRRDEFHKLGLAIVDADRRLNLRTRELVNERQTLENKVQERTRELNESLHTLKQTQDELIESAKLASLGELVAGVAHEINTPIGICLTGISHIQEENNNITQSLHENNLTRTDMDQYLDDIDKLSLSMLVSLNKATNLINSFKQVSADQHSDEKHAFNLHEYIDTILVSMQNTLKKTRVSIENQIPDKLVITSHAGVFYQIFTNFISNSLLHGYREGEDGRIIISGSVDHGALQLIYNDDGRGMEEETLKKIFQPFFTTRRNDGGTGLGMHIIYNLVSHKLNGNIQVESQPGEGVDIQIKIPLID